MVGSERAAVLLIAEGAIALIERVRAGERYFVVPGGGIEPGETAEDAAIREAAEELGLDVRLLAKAGTLEVAARGRLRQHYWFAECDSAVFGLMAGPELAEPDNSYRRVWVPLDRLDSIDLRPHEVRALIEDFPSRS